MKQRQRKHKLNAARRKDVRSPWARISGCLSFSHSMHDWFAELKGPVDYIPEHPLMDGEIGVVQGYRFITSPEVKA